MKGIYSRTFTVQDDKLNEAMEICKGLAEVRKIHFPDAHSYFSFQIGGNPRSFRETLIGEMFDGDYEKDMAMSADPSNGGGATPSIMNVCSVRTHSSFKGLVKGRIVVA